MSLTSRSSRTPSLSMAPSVKSFSRACAGALVLVTALNMAGGAPAFGDTKAMLTESFDEYFKADRYSLRKNLYAVFLLPSCQVNTIKLQMKCYGNGISGHFAVQLGAWSESFSSRGVQWPWPRAVLRALPPPRLANQTPHKNSARAAGSRRPL
ncbi:hypothetical protein EVAR_11962_1 [Eumeta japonica]|uniref:Uncharacterized protein n=1 Tax=Eumeta variegata TaxID=151549 RepID=A0A4C1U4P9_EUMVA|nr:hypothetical protein EVAR_11962_1 [Eumeta japonica]